MAGIMGSKSAKPRLSPSAAISAICWAAKAGSHELKVEKMAPAIAVLARAVLLVGFEIVKPLGRSCMERREMGFVDGLFWLMFLVELMLKHLAFNIAIVAIAVAID